MNARRAPEHECPTVGVNPSKQTSFRIEASCRRHTSTTYRSRFRLCEWNLLAGGQGCSLIIDRCVTSLRIHDSCASRVLRLLQSYLPLRYARCSGPPRAIFTGTGASSVMWPAPCRSAPAEAAPVENAFSSQRSSRAGCIECSVQADEHSRMQASVVAVEKLYGS